MIQIFRRLRQNLLSEGNTGKYLKYAIDEIALVVIGILIALQINNGNEARKNDLKESLLVKNIIEDLRLDSIHISQALHEVANQIRVTDELIARAMDGEKILNYNSVGLIRYSSDFRPIAQRNHAEAVSNLEDEFIRKMLQNYFIKEDEVKDSFLEYEAIIHTRIRPYLGEVGMHDIESLYENKHDRQTQVRHHPAILEEQLGNVKFQQLLFEGRLKTRSFQVFLNELKLENQELINVLSLKKPVKRNEQ
jgi:hypothetical protein